MTMDRTHFFCWLKGYWQIFTILFHSTVRSNRTTQQRVVAGFRRCTKTSFPGLRDAGRRPASIKASAVGTNGRTPR